MASKISTSFANERFDILNLLRVSTFGNVPVTEHDPTKTYNRGDCVYTYDEETHIVKVFKCGVEQTTGELNETEWSSSFAGSVSDSIKVSEEEPTNSDVQIWFKQIGEVRQHRLPE